MSKSKLTMCILVLAVMCLGSFMARAAPGDLDPEFLNGLSGVNGRILGIALQPDSKIIIGGNFTSVNGVARTNIARLNSDGTLDLSFNGLGGPNDGPRYITVLPSGKIIIAGYFTIVNGVTQTGVARLNADGSLDTGFINPNLKVGNTDNGVDSFAMQADGKMVIGGIFLKAGGVDHIGIARLNPDGTLDTSLESAIGVYDVRAITIQPDQKIVIGGTFTSINSVQRIHVARLNSNGLLDSGFLSAQSIPNGSSVEALALQTDGKVVVGGSFTVLGASSLARLNTDGTVDTTFINGMSGVNGIVYSLVVQADGKILAGGGFFSVNGLSRWCIVRVQPNGSVDTGFLDGQINGQNGAWGTVFGIAVQQDNKVLIGGSFTGVNSGGHPNLERLLAEPPNPQKIAFVRTIGGDTSTAEIYSINPDGSNETRLTNNSSFDSEPSFSADGTKIVFISNRDGNNEIYSMNSDGTNQVRLTNNTANDNSPSFNGDHSKIVFCTRRDGNDEIYTMNADGTNPVRLTNNAAGNSGPAFSFDGSKIVFASLRDGNSEIYSMNAIGTNQTRLTNDSRVDFEPVFSPDGTKIAFSSDRTGPNFVYEVFSMNADGTNQTNLTNNAASDQSPTFSSDGTKIAFSTLRNSNVDIFSMDASGSNQLRLTTNSEADLLPSWGGVPTGGPTTNTPAGSNITVQASGGDANATFTQVTVAGNTTFTAINPPSSAGTPPAGYTIIGVGPAYNITTTATFTPPATTCFTVSSVNDAASFARVRILHAEGVSLIDRTILAPSSPAPDFATRRVCASTTLLSQFVAAQITVSVNVSGRVTTPDGRGLRNATVKITDSNNVVRTATTSSFGFYSFDSVATGQSYTMSISSRLYRFSPRVVQVSGDLANVDFVGQE